jgi:hypothetical protein
MSIRHIMDTKKNESWYQLIHLEDSSWREEFYKDGLDFHLVKKKK